MKFGLIPEFIGRLPVIGAVANLDREALIRILSEPKNALVKQYRKLFEMENVELELHRRRARRDRRSGAAPRHRCPRVAGHPRRGAARHDVRPARPDDIASVVVDATVVREKVEPDPRARGATQPARRAPRRAAS